MTTENDMYGVSWKRCSLCGLTARDVAVREGSGGVAICPTVARCSAVKFGGSLGGPPLSLKPYTDFELDAEDHAAIARVVQGIRDREAQEPLHLVEDVSA